MRRSIDFSDVIDYLRTRQNDLEHKQQRSNLTIDGYHRLQDEWINVDELIDFLRQRRIDADPKAYAWDAAKLQQESGGTK